MVFFILHSPLFSVIMFSKLLLHVVANMTWHGIHPDAVQTSEALILQMNIQQLVALAAQYDLSIDKEHFVQKWHERFGDGLGFVRATFDAYDENKDGKLSILEIENIVKHALATVGKSEFCLVFCPPSSIKVEEYS